MRVYGRIFVPYPPSGGENSQQLAEGDYQWVEVSTDANGSDDYVYITALIQCLRLNLGESPFYARFGIPAAITVRLQMQPDFYVSYIQSYFSQFFASLIITKQPQIPTDAAFAKGGQAYTTPIYNVAIVRNNGSQFQTTVAL